MATTAAKPARQLDSKEVSLQGKIKSDFPKHTLEEALRVAQGLEEKNGGQALPPIETAEALGMSPGSSDYRTILSSSIKYGLTTGSFNSERVSLEERGRNVVEPTNDESKRVALVEAALTPPTFRSIYQHFRGKKLPEQAFFENTIIREFQVPREHAKKCVEVFMRNVESVGLVRNISTGKWLTTSPAQLEDPQTEAPVNGGKPEPTPTLASPAVPPVDGPKLTVVSGPSVKPKVFIAHGKSAQIVGQLKAVLTFGNFDPIVAEEYESTALPVPDKVLGLMRDCSAGIIHVASEDVLLDTAGATHHKLNENVLIEIGAAMALYGRKFILLVQKELHLPSNLSGLYCCYYEGDKLDYDSTMKLLKAFSDFRAQ